MKTRGLAELMRRGKGVLRRLTALLGAALALCLPTACNGENAQPSRELGIDLSAGQVVSSTDTHSGFHGDGRTCLALRFEGEGAEALERALTGRDGWEPLPLTENLSNGARSCLADEEPGKIQSISAIQNSFYCFLDRHSESLDEKDDSELFLRHSINFTLAIYDLDEKTLYYLRLDT